MSFDLISKIYSGKITRWNDKDIVDQNKDLKDDIPNKDIKVLIRDGSSGSTSVFTSGLSFYDSNWKSYYGQFASWPKQLAKKFKPTQGTIGMYSALSSEKYSLGYISYSAIMQSGIIPFVAFEHDGEVIVTPDLEKNAQVMLKVMFDKNNEKKAGSIIEKAKSVKGAWPITEFTYVVIDTQNDLSRDDCERRRELFEWLRWCLIDPNAKERGTKRGFSILPPSLAQRTIDQLADVTCDSVSLLAIEIVDKHEQGYFEGLLIMSMILLTLSVAPGIWLFIIKDNVLFVAKLYSLVLLIGATITYISVVFFYLVPDEDWICQLRVWLTSLGFTLFLGALFTRTLQIHRIYRLHNIKSTQEMETRGLLELGISTSVLVVLQIIILIVWTSTDALSASLTLRSDIDREYAWVCKSDNMWLWIGLEIAFFAVMLCYGLFVVYNTWEIKANFSEGKWILITIYNLFLLMAVLIPLFAILVINDDNLYIMAVTGINFAVMSTLLSLYFQRLRPQIMAALGLERSTTAKVTSLSNS